jgi:hypothetical protein
MYSQIKNVGGASPFPYLNVFTGEKCGRGKPLPILECIHR